MSERSPIQSRNILIPVENIWARIGSESIPQWTAWREFALDILKEKNQTDSLNRIIRQHDKSWENICSKEKEVMYESNKTYVNSSMKLQLIERR